jgi:hypothetical protein
MRVGSVPSSVKIFIKAASARSGVVTQTLLTLTVPGSVNPRPTPVITLAPTFSHLAQTLNAPTTEVVNGTSTHVFTFFSAYAGTVTNSLVQDTEYEFAEVRFDYPGIQDAQLRLASLPDGGSSTISYLLWEMGGNNVTNPTAVTYGTGSTNSASGFSGYSFVPLSVVLPVKFLSFFAVRNGEDARLTWNVENDQQNRAFEIERSLDGRNFTQVNKVSAMGNGRSQNSYEATDARITNLGKKAVYYRIKQIDLNGEFVYSPIRTVNLDARGASVSLFPNPVRDLTKLVIDANGEGKASIVIRDASGKQVQMINTRLVKGMNQQDLNLGRLPGGSYTVTVLGGALNESIKFTKIN